jgi:hypothetical protein
LESVEAPQILNKTFKDDEDGLLYDVKGVRILTDRTMVADIALHGSTKKLRTPILVGVRNFLFDPCSAMSATIVLSFKILIKQAVFVIFEGLVQYLSLDVC